MAISRRDFLKGAAALTATGLLAGCAAPADTTTQSNAADTTTADNAPEVITPVIDYGTLDASEFESSEVIAETITNWDEEKNYEIIVVGAGAAGVCAALTANKYSDSVCVLQKASVAISQGSGPNGVNYDTSDMNGLLAFANQFQEENQYRSDRAQFMTYLKYSYDAINLTREAAEEGAADHPDIPFKYSESVSKYGGYEVTGISLKFTPKPVSNSEGVILLSDVAEKRGVDYYYETPGVQLIKEDGKVVGIIGKNAEGKLIRFNASKGVILCTGDYQNNNVMVDKYCPDVSNFERKQFGKTGDGHLMAIMAGAVMEPIGHTKMLHDMDSSPVYTFPFLMVDVNGDRIMNETIAHEKRNNLMRNRPQPGVGIQIFDSNYGELMKAAGRRATGVETLEKYLPGYEGDMSGLYPGLVGGHRADTLEALADSLGIPADNLIKTVNEYNALCDAGIDTQYGKDPVYLAKIEQGPFWGFRNHYRISAICSGVLVNEHCQVLDAENNIIPGLYACGNTAGQFFGGADYPFTMKGVSLGRAYTQGHIAARHALEQL